jgi:hypothetical protein
MSGPGARSLGEDIAPKIEITINDVPLKADLMSLLKSAEFEHCTQMISAGSITLENPGFRLFNAGPAPQVHAGRDQPPVESLLSHVALQPGEIMAFKFGYGQKATEEVGRMIIHRHMPVYRESGFPELTVPGMDAGKLMTGVQGSVKGETDFNQRNAHRVVKGGFRKKTEADFRVLGKNRRVASRNNEGTMWMISKKRGMRPSEIVKEIAKKYSYYVDIPAEECEGELKIKHLPMLQPKGMDDYKFVQHLANIYGKEFWIDWGTVDSVQDLPSADGRSRMDTVKAPGWVLHWRYSEARKMTKTGAQPKPMFRFIYAKDEEGNAANHSSLLSFEPQFAMQDVATDISVTAFDPVTGEARNLLEAPLVPGTKDRRFHVGGGRRASAKAVEDQRNLAPRPRAAKKPSLWAGALAASLTPGANLAGTLAANMSAANQANTTGEQRRRADLKELRWNRKEVMRFAELEEPVRYQVQAGGLSIDILVQPGALAYYTDDEDGEEYEAGVDDILEKLTLHVERITGLYRDFFVTGQGVAVGNEKVRAGQVHYIDGLDPVMNGLWEFKKVKHVWGENGYRIHFTASKLFL